MMRLSLKIEYRITPHLYKGKEPCYKLQYRKFFKWYDYTCAEGVPVWWTYQEAQRVLGHMNSDVDLKDSVVKLRAVK